MSLIELANHNDDIRRLLEKGYALLLDSGHLVVRDIPYINNLGALAWGAIVAKLVYVDRVRVKQDNHQIYFAGGSPHRRDGAPIQNMGDSNARIPLERPEIVVERSFSNKPKDANNNWVDYSDFYHKIEAYVNVIAGPAIEAFNVSPLTFRADKASLQSSPFKFQDTMTSRAEIGDLSSIFRNDVVAIIGLGGTGGFILDFVSRMSVKEIRAFDGDFYHVHNAFRSPGRLLESELGKSKAIVFQQRYESFREGLNFKAQYIDKTSAPDLAGVTFAFVCVDKGSARKEIFDLLISLKIPFIDVGMGLNRHHGTLAGTIRATLYSVEDALATRDRGFAELADLPDDMYRQNVQIGELNALNACLAVMRYKKFRGFFHDGAPWINMLLELGEMNLFPETRT